MIDMEEGMLGGGVIIKEGGFITSVYRKVGDPKIFKEIKELKPKAP